MCNCCFAGGGCRRRTIWGWVIGRTCSLIEAQSTVASRWCAGWFTRQNRQTACLGSTGFWADLCPVSFVAEIRGICCWNVAQNSTFGSTEAVRVLGLRLRVKFVWPRFLVDSLRLLIVAARSKSSVLSQWTLKNFAVCLCRLEVTCWGSYCLVWILVASFARLFFCHWLGDRNRIEKCFCVAPQIFNARKSWVYWEASSSLSTSVVTHQR
jgi:hypothetical protein